MIENKDIRKLALYSRDGHFNTCVDTTVVSCFIQLINLNNVHMKKDIAVLKARPEAQHFTIDEY